MARAGAGLVPVLPAAGTEAASGEAAGGGAAGDAVGFEQTEDGRWLALLRKDASVPSLRDTAAAPLRGGYATAVFPPVEVEEQSAR